MEAIVKQTLGDVHRGDAGVGFDPASTRDKLMHAAISVWNIQEVLHLTQEIVGIEYRVFRGFTQSFSAQRSDVEVATKQDADIAKEDLTNFLEDLANFILND